jgi:hypothetical protein
VEEIHTGERRWRDIRDGFKEYTTAILTHYGQWVQLARRHATGPHPKLHWMPLPQLRYAQVVKTVRRRRARGFPALGEHAGSLPHTGDDAGHPRGSGLLGARAYVNPAAAYGFPSQP